MTSPFLSLIRFSVLSVYAPSRRGAGKVGAKATAKDIGKLIGVILLVLVSAGSIGALYVYMSDMSYRALKGTGMESLVLLNAAITATLISFVLCFLTALSTYCSKADANLLALPIEGRKLLGAKMAMVFVSDFALSFLVMAIAIVIYAVNESPPALFYAGAIASLVAVPLTPLALAYLILVPLVSVARPLRSKNAIMVIGGIVGIGLSLGLNVYFQTSMPKMVDPEWVRANYAGPDSLIMRMGMAYPPALLAWKAMAAGGLSGILSALAVLGIGFGAVSAVAAAFGPWYAKSLLGFDEMRMKRVAATRDFYARAFSRRPPLASLFLREWRLMNREPVYFMNGPFIIVLMPAIMAIGVVISLQRAGGLGDLGPMLAAWRDGPWLMLAASAIGAFLGSSTSITCTALSRDAKALRYIKALPVAYRDYMLAKFLHGFAFAVFGSLVGALGLSALLGLPALDAAGAFLIALAISGFACIAGLWLDTANPRLSWDNPIAAMKQNVNAVVIMLGVMGLLGGLGFASAFMGFGKAAFFALYFLGFAAATAAALAAYPRYAKRKLEEIEA